MSMDLARMKVFKGKYLDKGIEGEMYFWKGAFEERWKGVWDKYEKSNHQLASIG